MEITECKFNPEVDMKPVDPFGFIDLKDAFVNKCVPSQVADSDSDYNGIEDPASILGVPTDIFEAMSYNEIATKDSSSNDTE